MPKKILVINPGSTSTKVSLFEDTTEVWQESVNHEAEDLAGFHLMYEQFPYRLEMLEAMLAEKGVSLSDLDAVAGRGGCIRPCKGGTYHVNDRMREDCRIGYSAQHASNLGALLAWELASRAGLPSFIADPVVTDEMSDVAKVTGLKGVRRKSRAHPLNQKAAARKMAEKLGKSYEECRFIVAHLGGGISIGAHENGLMIDMNDAGDGDGPFSPERAGTLPTEAMLDLCFSGEYEKKDIKRLLMGKTGVVSLLGTNNMLEVKKRIAEGDKEAELVLNAMAYHIARHIGAAATVLKGRVDAVIITGGLAYYEALMEDIRSRVAFIAPVQLFPGQFEMEALASASLRVLNGEEEAREYDDTTIVG